VAVEAVMRPFKKKYMEGILLDISYSNVNNFKITENFLASFFFILGLGQKYVYKANYSNSIKRKDNSGT
jgi:hypothetical protein